MRTISTLLLSTFILVFQACAQAPSAQNSSDEAVAEETSSTEAPVNPKWETQIDPLYTISYPADWEVTYTGQKGLSFVAISPQASAGDRFRENTSLVIQDMQGADTDLESFTAENVGQIQEMIVGSELLQNEPGESHGIPYREVKYTGTSSDLELIYTQRYMVHNGNAYVLSFTADKADYPAFADMADQILNGFKLK